MTGKPNDDDMLESFFRAARSNPEVPDNDLLARVFETAEQEQSIQMQGPATKDEPQEATILQHVTGALARFGLGHAPLRALGGWPVAAGFVAAASTGIMIGALPQSPVSTSGIFLVSDAGAGFADWGDLTAFGLEADISALDRASGNSIAEDVQ